MTRLKGRYRVRQSSTHPRRTRKAAAAHSATSTTTTTTTRTHHTTRHHNHGPTAAPVHHHRRRPSLGDKVSGAMLKLKGTLTGRRGQKAAGTRRMHGTDGRGSHRARY
ncbi:MAG: hypothetical protein M1817_002418 [Caeruleum heppii]|nr:MAG: hypothetical protein M1817_002418 [Caeruleum heppii]